MTATLGDIAAILPVVDLNEAAHFYRSLGFTVDEYPDGNYAWVMSFTVEVLHLAVVETLDREANHAAVYLHVEDVDTWHTRWVRAGVEVTAVEDKPWGMREFSIRDPDGNLLRVGQNT